MNMKHIELVCEEKRQADYIKLAQKHVCDLQKVLMAKLPLVT